MEFRGGRPESLGGRPDSSGCGPESPALTPRLREAAPSDGQWSVGEILHHLQLIERWVARVPARQRERAKTSGVPGGTSAPNLRQESVHGSLDQFDVEWSPEKITAPSGFIPSRDLSRQELLGGLSDSRSALLAEVARAGAHDLSRLTFPHPVLGRLDMCQWLLCAAQHELRHLHQIERAR